MGLENELVHNNSITICYITGETVQWDTVMLTVWVLVTPEHPAAAAAAAEHCAGMVSQLCSQKCTLRAIPAQWDADFSFTAGLNDSLRMPASHVDPDSISHLCCCLHSLQQPLLVLGVCRGWRDLSYERELCLACTRHTIVFKSESGDLAC